MSPLLALLLQVADPSTAASLSRPVPPSCSDFLALEPGSKDRERAWNESYKAGWEAIESGELDLAGRAICRALAESRGFDARDLRFAETLDELGLLHFRRGEVDMAERAQGAAVAEVLLAAGPRHANVELYLSRLGIVLERQGRGELLSDLRRAPHRVFALGHVPLEPELANRLDWLVSQYLLLEDLGAASALQDLVAGITATHAPKEN